MNREAPQAPRFHDHEPPQVPKFFDVERAKGRALPPQEPPPLGDDTVAVPRGAFDEAIPRPIDPEQD